MTLQKFCSRNCEGAYYCQRDVDAHYEPGQSPPEARLDEREHGDGEDERGEEVRSLVGDDEDERHEHQGDTDRGPQLRHPPQRESPPPRRGAWRALCGRARGDARRLSGFRRETSGTRRDFVVGQLLAQRLDFLG